MIANIIYFLVFIILAFVLSIAVKAITRGVEAKQIIKEEKDTKLNVENEDQNQNSEVDEQHVIFSDETLNSSIIPLKLCSL